jgi:hypothetical protein
VGTYTLKADAPGFKTYALTDVEVHVQNVVTADVPLAVGEVNQQVSVTSKVPLLQAQDASLGQTIPSSQVNDLPLNGRNWLSLTQLAAGTSATSGSSPDNPEQLQDNGVSQTQVDYRLNGIDNNIDIFEAALARAGSVAPVRTLCRRPTCTTANFTNLQDLITGNSGTATDGLGRTFSNGTILKQRALSRRTPSIPSPA